MQDNRLLLDLIEANYPSEATEKLSAQGIKTYARLFAALRDEGVLTETRESACRAVFALWQTIDRRVAVPALLKTLRSAHPDLRHITIRTLGHLNAQLAVKPLIEVAQDRNEDTQTRYFAVEALGAIRNEQVKPILRSLVLDQTDSVYVRSAVIEWAYSLSFPILA